MLCVSPYDPRRFCIMDDGPFDALALNPMRAPAAVERRSLKLGGFRHLCPGRLGHGPEDGYKSVQQQSLYQTPSQELLRRCGCWATRLRVFDNLNVSYVTHQA